MALKAILASLDGLDEATKALYTKGEDGKYHLDVEGMVGKSKLDEFREKNVQMAKELQTLKDKLAQFDGIDLKKYQELVQSFENDTERKLIKEGKIDEVFQMRLAKLQQSYEEKLKAKDTQIAQLTKERDSATQDRDTHIVTSELSRAITDPESGFHPNADRIIQDQVLKNFKYRDGKVVRVNAEGAIVFGEKGEPATIGEFLTEIAKDHPYLVKSSSGGGASNNGGPKNSGAKTIRRSEFDAIQDHARKAKMMKDGVVVVD